MLFDFNSETMNLSKDSPSNNGAKGGWIRYAKKFCFCNHVCAIKVSMTVENRNRLFYRCKHEPEESCGYFRWCEPIGCETETTQKVDSNMMEFDDELDGVLVDQTLKFDAMKKELEGKLAELRNLMEEEIENVKNESEMAISNLRKLAEAQVHLVKEESKDNLLEVKKNVEVEIASFKKIVMEELAYVKQKQVDEASLLKEDIGRSNRLLCKLK